MKSHPKFTTVLGILITSLWGYLAIPLVKAQLEPQSPPAQAEPALPLPPSEDEQSELSSSVSEETEAMAQGFSLKPVRERLLGYQSIQATIQQQVALEHRQFEATGSYLQASNLRMRAEFHYDIDGFRVQLLEVCDGQVLWSRKSVGKEITLSRRDVREILNAGQQLQATSPAGTAGSLLTARLGQGGLPALFASLERAMIFAEPEEKSINNHPFLLLTGTWNPQFLKKWDRKSQGKNSKLPPGLPDQVRIYLDKTSLFPRRIQYLKQRAGEEQPVPVLTISFLDVVLNGQIDPRQFEFVPPDGVIPTDTTQQYIERLQKSGKKKR